ncbi:MAG: hypothetical protein IKG93_10235 [Clostridiales bacterium]|nr:hypothetical protein [Clostridiales bacterium]
MSAFSYEKISKISLSSSSNGMMMGSNQSCSEDLLWDEDGITLTKTEIRGSDKEVSVWNISAEQAEKIRAFAEREDMAVWGSWKYEEDPRFRCTDYSSNSSGSIILDYRGKGGKPYEIVTFKPRAVFDQGKGDAMRELQTLFEELEDPETRAKHTKEKLGSGIDRLGSFNGFMGMGMVNMPGGAGGKEAGTSSPEVPTTVPEGSWACDCGTVNTGKFCCECGKARPV